MNPTDWFLSWRNKLVAKPTFQRFASRFFLTKAVSAKQSQEVFDLCAGFVYSQILAALVDLKVLEQLAKRPCTLQQLASTTALPADKCLRLMKAGVAIGLCVERSGDRYALGMKGAALLGNPGALQMIAHHRLFYADMADPVGLLRGTARPTALERYWAYDGEKADSDAPAHGQASQEYSRLMSESISLLIDDVLAAYPFQNHVHMMDIGGGNGAFIRKVKTHHPKLAYTLFDLPPVAALAESRFSADPVGTSVTCVGGDARSGPLPKGADLISFIRILHDHDDGPVMEMLTQAYAALEPGGTVLIAEPMASVGADRVADAYFGFYLLAMGSGRARSPKELTGMLEKVGFANVRQRPSPRPLLATTLVAEKLSPEKRTEN